MQIRPLTQGVKSRKVFKKVSTLREVPWQDQKTSSACSVELGPLRFKIWHKSPTYLCLLSGQDHSALLEFREGEMLTMEYFDADSTLPSERLKAAVRKIKRNDGERLKVNIWLI